MSDPPRVPKRSTGQTEEETGLIRCAGCGHVQTGGSFCHSCNAYLAWAPDEQVEIRVHGSNAAEVEQVARSLGHDEAERRARAREDDRERRVAARLRSPWTSGSFYLVAIVVLLVALLVVARVAQPWALPVVLVGAVLAVAVVGALQLRQDEKLSEKNFLALMRLTLARLSLVVRPQRPPPER